MSPGLLGSIFITIGIILIVWLILTDQHQRNKSEKELKRWQKNQAYYLKQSNSIH